MKKFVTLCLAILMAMATMADDWVLVTDASTLEAGDEIVLACNTQDVTAGTFNTSNGYFAAITSAVFSSDKRFLTSMGASTYVLTLDGQADAWKLSINGNYFGASAARKLLVNKGTMTWTISIDANGEASITNTTTDYGTILYNKTSPRFLNYPSAQTPIQIYRKKNIPRYTLTYEGYPMAKIACEEPTFEAGTQVTLSAGVPEKEGDTFVGWRYRGVIYQPGDVITITDENVELEAVWNSSMDIETVLNQLRAIKILRDGQLLIVRDGAEYNVLGVRIK